MADEVAVQEEAFVETILDEAELEPQIEEEVTDQSDAEIPEGVASDESDQTAQPRDEKGQYASPEDAEPVAPALADQPEAPPETTEDLPGFSFRSYGQDITDRYSGSKVGSDGSFFPTEAATQLQYDLSQAHGAQRREADLQTQMEALRREGSEEVALAKELVLEFEKFRDLRHSNPDEAQVWLDNLDNNFETMTLRAQLAAAKAGQDASNQQINQRAQDQQTEDLSNQMETSLRSYVGELAKDPKYAGIDADDMLARFSDLFVDRIFYQSQHDDPVNGIRKGEVVFDRSVIDAEFERHVSLTSRVSTETAAAVKGNAAATTQPDVPPTVPAGGGEAPTATKEIPTFEKTPEGKRKMNAWLDEYAGSTYSK